MTAKFNELGARGLLLNTLPLDNNLDLLLESKPLQQEVSKPNVDQQIPNNIKKIVKGKFVLIQILWATSQ
jgi:hypothetical protein